MNEFALTYLNDILIFTFKSLKKYCEHVIKVLQRLKNTKLQLDINKCEFEIEFTKYLEFIIEADKSIHINPTKIKAIVE